MAARSLGPGKKAAGAEKANLCKQIYHCPYCDQDKKETEFYISSDPLVLTGRVVMCRDCCEKIARNYNTFSGIFGDCTRDSIMNCLERIDKPWIEVVWEGAVKEVNDPNAKRRKTNLWAAYIKNITSLRQYKEMRWRDGDNFKSGFVQSDESIQTHNQEILDECEQNRKDIIRLVGYDPFANYPVREDLPLLYAQLIAFMDDETKNDGMKMNAIIQIVQAFNQIQKINDAMNILSADSQKLNANNGTIKQHADTISKLLAGANALAKDNGISVNFNNSKSKGQNTLTGKMKDLDLIGFRAAKINMYDIEYCEGMRQVAEISAKAQVNQIGFDENVMNDIHSIRRELVDDLQKAKDKAEERARVLLVENQDLKRLMREKGLIDDAGRVTDDE